MKYLYLIIIFCTLISCEKKVNKNTSYCVKREGVDYSFKDNEFYYNNWNRRNSSFNIGFQHPYNSSIFNYKYIRNSLEKKDTIFFLGRIKADGIHKKEQNKAIFKVFVNDSINVLDTLDIPENVNFNNHYRRSLSPSGKNILITYLNTAESRSEIVEVLSTTIVIYDFNSWEKTSEYVFPSQAEFKDFCWSPHEDKVVFYDNSNGDVVLLNLLSGEFVSLMKEKSHSHINPRWGLSNDKVYFKRNSNTLLQLNLNTMKVKKLYRTKKHIFQRKKINDFHLLSENKIYLELSTNHNLIPKIFDKHHDCMLEICK